MNAISSSGRVPNSQKDRKKSRQQVLEKEYAMLNKSMKNRTKVERETRVKVRSNNQQLKTWA